MTHSGKFVTAQRTRPGSVSPKPRSVSIRWRVAFAVCSSRQASTQRATGHRGEALVRRILKGQGLYHINCIVDINNICSIESLFPLGAYDRERIIGDVTIRLGAPDEVYRGIGKGIDIAGKLVSADSEGAFGSPIADSDRTMISEDTREVLVLLYAPESTDDSDIRNTLNRFAELAGEHASAQTGNSGVLSGS